MPRAVPSVQYYLLGGDRMMHVEALQWLSCIFTHRLRAKCHQLYELGNANKIMPGAPRGTGGDGDP